MRNAPSSIGAPGNSIMAFLPVHTANKLFIIKGPKIEVRLIIPVMPPDSSPCPLAGTAKDISLCSAGPAIPPKQYTVVKAYIIQVELAKANNNMPAK